MSFLPRSTALAGAAVALSMFLGCGGAPRPAPVEPTPAPDAELCTIAVRVEDATGSSAIDETSEDDLPRQALTVVRICERAGTATLALPTEGGVCQPEDSASGAVAAATCWWAGIGAVIEVRHVGGELVVSRIAFDEESPPGDPVEVGRLALPPGAETVPLEP